MSLSRTVAYRVSRYEVPGAGSAEQYFGELLLAALVPEKLRAAGMPEGVIRAAQGDLALGPRVALVRVPRWPGHIRQMLPQEGLDILSAYEADRQQRLAGARWIEKRVRVDVGRVSPAAAVRPVLPAARRPRGRSFRARRRATGPPSEDADPSWPGGGEPSGDPRAPAFTPSSRAGPMAYRATRFGWARLDRRGIPIRDAARHRADRPTHDAARP